MSRATKASQSQSSSQLAAVSIDSGAALTLCSILLEVLAQMPEARTLIRAALDKAETESLAEIDATTRAAELIAMGRLREVCEIQALKAA